MIVIVSVIAFLLLLTSLNLYVTYYNTVETVEMTVANKGKEVASSILTRFDTAAYEEFMENRHPSDTYYKIRSEFNDAREYYNVLHVYTLVADEENKARVMISGFSAKGEEISIGEYCIIPSKYIPALIEGRPFYTDIIDDKKYGAYITAGVPIYNKNNDYLGILAVDISTNNVNDITEEVLSKSIPVFIFNGLFVVLSFGLFVFIQKWVRKEINIQVDDTEVTYQVEFNAMLHTLRSIRHDFINHIQVIQGLLKIGRQERAFEYVTSLTSEIETIELPVKVNNPALFILLQAKWVRAQNEKVDIHLFVDESDFNKVKSKDLIKILSNLIDNAFDATLNFPEKERFIKIEIHSSPSSYTFIVENIGPIIPPDLQMKIFESGFSTKEERVGNPRGEGLFIIKQVVESYGGTIHLKSEKMSTKFSVFIPF
ncbi:ATP-binding protein [Metabacillus fastidiosus]|uniref:ATP-binding protein n=1 Tax=Metabacillus fastidiosus TaxID=1458 RepID=UPI000825728C|nr:ATP-binding protein [Metabacillus fastidiosus]MED4455234.1 Spo0B domain-containing protein [Metabacillus fastidiosus]MED4461422.1 Spo0B domain-containing protein [Metabacillus fastidiosus]